MLKFNITQALIIVLNTTFQDPRTIKIIGRYTKKGEAKCYYVGIGDSKELFIVSNEKDRYITEEEL